MHVKVLTIFSTPFYVPLLVTTDLLELENLAKLDHLANNGSAGVAHLLERFGKELKVCRCKMISSFQLKPEVMNSWLFER